uniref:Uncharacterized protein n=1 Tax=Rhodopseudomonas palustris (strain DX-1) TaxID=652103 RepID=E6VQ03_RHOPX
MRTPHPRALRHHRYSSRSSIDDLTPVFEAMIDKVFRAVVTDPKPDSIFGRYSEIASVARSIAFHEGKLLEWGIAAIARCNPDLLILPQERAMPIVPAAIELLRKNEWQELRGIRLHSEVHASKTYTPDLFIANRVRHAGLIMDVKRSLGSYAECRLEELRFRMLAVAAIASSWLSERQGPLLVEVGIAIIDGADTVSDHTKGVFKLSEIGDLLEVDRADDAMTRLREMFAERVQQELESQCRKVMRAETQQRGQNRNSGDVADGGALNNPAAVDSPHAVNGEAPTSMACVSVGYARSRRPTI